MITKFWILHSRLLQHLPKNVPNTSPLQNTFLKLRTNIHVVIIVTQQDFVLKFSHHALVWREAGTMDPYENHQASYTFTFSMGVAHMV